MLFIVVISIVVTISVTKEKKTQEFNISACVSKSWSFEDAIYTNIFGKLVNSINSTLVSEPNSDQRKSMCWLASDRFNVGKDLQTTLQRYALAVFYYSLGGGSSDGTTFERKTEEGTFTDNWLSDTSECDWSFITCIDDIVTELAPYESNLVGTLPAESGLLSDLVLFGVENNRHISGSIPSNIFKLTKLSK